MGRLTGIGGLPSGPHGSESVLRLPRLWRLRGVVDLALLVDGIRGADKCHRSGTPAAVKIERRGFVADVAPSCANRMSTGYSCPSARGGPRGQRR